MIDGLLRVFPNDSSLFLFSAFCLSAPRGKLAAIIKPIFHHLLYLYMFLCVTTEFTFLLYVFTLMVACTLMALIRFFIGKCFMHKVVLR